MKRALLKFNYKYFFIALLLFLIEVCIAMYVKISIIRHFFGDVLVVILIYTFLKSIFNIPVKPAVIGVLIFSYLIETFQYFNGIELLGLKENYLARLIIGTTFVWSDLVAYTMGAALIFLFEKR